MALLIDPAIATNVATDDEIESQEEQEVDTNGRPVMVESGEYREKLINHNSTPRFTLDPVMVPKMRPIPAARVAALKEQRNRNLDRLAKLEHKAS